MSLPPSPDWVKRYEDLRAHTLGSWAAVPAQAWGLVVFLQQGMRGWMRAWQEEPPPEVAESARDAAAPAAAWNRAPEATALLANMTLRCLGLS